MEFICLDIETTGLDFDTAEIIEVAAVRFNETEILDYYQTFIKYEKPIPEIVVHLTGITTEMTKDAPELKEVAQAILDFCGNAPIVGHNINFDITFLKNKGVTLSNTLFDTLPLSHILVQDIPSHSLEVLCKKLNKTYFPSHRAQDDCTANIELFHTFLQKIQNLPSSAAYFWKQILTKSNSQWNQILLNLVPEGTYQKELPTEFLEFQTSEFEATHNSQPINFNQQITESTNTSLFVVSPTTQKKLTAEYTQIPDLNSEISRTKFEQNLAKSELSEQETILHLKIATQFANKNPLFSSDLNLSHEDYGLLKDLTETNYRIPSSSKPYIVNHFTYFKLLKEKKLTAFEKTYFEELPFLEEIYIRASEKKINLNSIESKDLPTGLIFNKLFQFANTIKSTDNNEYGNNNSVLLDNYTFNFPEFQDFLNQIEPELPEQIQELKRNFSNYLIWIHQYDDQVASVSYLPRNIDQLFSIEKVCKYSNTKNFIQATNQFSVDPIYLQIPEKFPDPNDFAYNQILADFLFAKLKNLETQALIIAPAKVQITYLHKKLALQFSELGINLLTQDIGGSKGKILHNLENNEAPSILLCTQYFFLRNYPELKNLTHLFITKLPMSLPNHPFYEYKKTTVQNSFMELLVPNTANTITEIMLQAKQENPNLDQFYLLDTRTIYKNWGQEIINNFPKNINTVNCQFD